MCAVVANHEAVNEAHMSRTREVLAGGTTGRAFRIGADRLIGNTAPSKSIIHSTTDMLATVKRASALLRGPNGPSRIQGHQQLLVHQHLETSTQRQQAYVRRAHP